MPPVLATSENIEHSNKENVISSTNPPDAAGLAENVLISPLTLLKNVKPRPEERERSLHNVLSEICQNQKSKGQRKPRVKNDETKKQVPKPRVRKILPKIDMAPVANSLQSLQRIPVQIVSTKQNISQSLAPGNLQVTEVVEQHIPLVSSHVPVEQIAGSSTQEKDDKTEDNKSKEQKVKCISPEMAVKEQHLPAASKTKADSTSKIATCKNGEEETANMKCTAHKEQAQNVSEETTSSLNQIDNSVSDRKSVV